VQHNKLTLLNSQLIISYQSVETDLRSLLTPLQDDTITSTNMQQWLQKLTVVTAEDLKLACILCRQTLSLKHTINYARLNYCTLLMQLHDFRDKFGPKTLI